MDERCHDAEDMLDAALVVSRQVHDTTHKHTHTPAAHSHRTGDNHFSGMSNPDEVHSPHMSSTVEQPLCSHAYTGFGLYILYFRVDNNQKHRF